MTNQQGAPEALRLADKYAAAHAKWALEDLYGTSKSYTAEMLAERHAARELAMAASQPSPTAQAAESVPAVLGDDELVRLGKSPESGLPPWGIGTTRADYLRAVRAVLAAARAPADGVTAPAGGGVAGIEAAAKLLERKAEDFARENGSDDLGSLSFGRGAHADAKLEYHSTLLELADEIRSLAPPPPAQAADSVLEDAAASEVLMEHSGCGSGTQVDMLTVRLNPGDKVIMLKGRITQAIDAARKQGANHD